MATQTSTLGKYLPISSDKLNVEFDVIRTTKTLAYAFHKKITYEEKYLAYNGRPLKYKAILKNGKLMAIVGKRYKLIPNEHVDYIVYKVAEELGYKKINLTNLLWDSKYAVLLIADDHGFLIKNSIDQSWSLSVHLAIRVGNKYTIVKSPLKVRWQRKHTKNASFDSAMLKALIEEGKKNIDLYKSTLERAKKHTLDVEELKVLIDEFKMPKKYVPPFYRGMSLYEAYERILTRIWNDNDSKTPRKLDLINMLNEWLFYLLEK